MVIPEEKLSELEGLIEKYKSGIFPADATALFLGKSIIDHKALELLNIAPQEISSQLVNMVKALKRDGYVFSYSSLGDTDYTEYAHQLADLIGEN